MRGHADVRVGAGDRDHNSWARCWCQRHRPCWPLEFWTCRALVLEAAIPIEPLQQPSGERTASAPLTQASRGSTTWAGARLDSLAYVFFPLWAGAQLCDQSFKVFEKLEGKHMAKP